MVNYGGVLTLMIAAALKVTNVLGWGAAIAYIFLSVSLEYAAGIKNAPQIIVMYASAIFAAYLVLGALLHRMSSAKLKQRRFTINLSITSVLFVFLLGYLFAIMRVGRITAFIITLAIYFAVGLRQLQQQSSAIKAAFVISIAHAIVFSGGRMLISPAYNAASYIIITIMLSEIRAAFSTACKPEDLKEGMLLAESIEHDGKNYVFGLHPYPGTISVLRYAAGDILGKKRVIISIFTALKSLHIAELRQIAKTHNKKTYLIQKRIDFLPFLIVGAVLAYVLR